MSMPGSTLTAGPHRRYNPLLDEWVLVSPHRLDRPWQGQVEAPHPAALPAYDPGCYLCPGNTRANGERNPAYAATYAFDNDLPALLAGSAALAAAGDELFVTQPQSGRCRVVCFSPRHDLTLAQMDACAIRAVVDTWADEVDRLAHTDGIGYVQVFENKGAAMGCSNPHPHCQIYATNFVFKTIENETRTCRSYWEDHHRVLMEAIVAAEKSDGRRILSERNSAIAFIPYFARYAYETFVSPQQARQCLSDLPRDEMLDLADAGKEALRQSVDRP